MRRGMGPWGPGAASSRMSTSGGPTVGSHDSYCRIRSSPAGVVYASRIDAMPSSNEAAATSDGRPVQLPHSAPAPRMAIATLVSVGLAEFAVGMSPLPASTSPCTPHTREYESHTLVPSSAVPIRTVPM